MVTASLMECEDCCVLLGSTCFATNAHRSMPTRFCRHQHKRRHSFRHDCCCQAVRGRRDAKQSQFGITNYCMPQHSLWTHPCARWLCHCCVGAPQGVRCCCQQPHRPKEPQPAAPRQEQRPPWCLAAQNRQVSIHFFLQVRGGSVERVRRFVCTVKEQHAYMIYACRITVLAEVAANVPCNFKVPQVLPRVQLLRCPGSHCSCRRK
jgi:hypothetical protein